MLAIADLLYLNVRKWILAQTAQRQSKAAWLWSVETELRVSGLREEILSRNIFEKESKWDSDISTRELLAGFTRELKRI